MFFSHSLFLAFSHRILRALGENFFSSFESEKVKQLAEGYTPPYDTYPRSVVRFSSNGLSLTRVLSAQKGVLNFNKKMIQMPLAEFEEMKQHFQRDKQELQNERKLLEQELAEKDEEIAALKAKLQELN